MTTEQADAFRARVEAEFDAIRDVLDAYAARHDTADEWVERLRPRVEDLYETVSDPKNPHNHDRQIQSLRSDVDRNTRAAGDTRAPAATDWRAQLASAFAVVVDALGALSNLAKVIIGIVAILLTMLLTGTSFAELLGFDPRAQLVAEQEQAKALKEIADEPARGALPAEVDSLTIHADEVGITPEADLP